MSMTTRRWRKSCGRFPPFRRTGDHRPPEAEAAGVLPTAAYGHFGRKEFAWEQVDATEELQSKAKSG